MPASGSQHQQRQQHDRSAAGPELQRQQRHANTAQRSLPLAADAIISAERK